MALPAVKGAIIVGGVAVAIGVALYEHEPTREWFKERGRDINSAFEDFMNDIQPERRRKHMYGQDSGSQPSERVRFPWDFRRRRSRDAHNAGQSTGAASGMQGQESGAIRRRRGSGGLELDEMSRHAVSEEAILDEAGPDSARQSSEMDRSSYQHLLLPQEAAHSATTFDEILRPGSVVSADHDRGMLTPSTSHGALSEMGTSEGSIEFIHTPTSTRPGSVAHGFSEDEDEDARSHTTETMSQISRDDDMRSVASSWSAVSHDDDIQHVEHANV